MTYDRVRKMQSVITHCRLTGSQQSTKTTGSTLYTVLR